MQGAWTTDEVAYLVREYPHSSSEDIANILGRKVTSVYNKAAILKIKKTSAYRVAIAREAMMNPNHGGRKFLYKKGRKPENKGKKWDQFMSVEGQLKARKTTFKTGHIPHNAKEVGAIVIYQRKDRNAAPYKMIKLHGTEKLTPLHRFVWARSNGAIPTGFNIVFKNHDTMDCSLDNLLLVSNEDLMTMNTIHRYPDDIKAAIKAITKLSKIIKNYQK